MTPRYRWRRTWREKVQPVLLLVVASTIVGGAIGAKAHATPQQDGRFLYALGQAGFAYESATPVIVTGHTVCDLLDAGGTIDQAAESIMGATDLTKPWSLKFVQISIQVFCGRHGDALRPHLGGNGTRKVGVIA